MCVRRCDWPESAGIIDGEKLYDLRFADDLVLYSTNSNDLQMMLTELNEKGQSARLKMT